MFLAAVVAPTTILAAEKKPNVVFILADNVGYGDMGPYGGGELRGFATPRTDQLAREGIRLTQYLVEPACTPSRAALMTGQYSIRNGLSLVSLPGGPNQLSANAYTMGQLFKGAGYATAIFGKWHLGESPQSLPGAHGFDEFYGIPPGTSWDDAITVPIIAMTHSIEAPEKTLYEKLGGWIVQQKAGGPLERVKPFTPEVRAEIDVDLTDRSIDFMKRQKAAGKPFFVYLPFSMGHAPNYPSKQFAGKSRIGNYGDKMMEGDYHVGRVLDALKELKVEDNTIVVFASDNGPWRFPAAALGNLGSPDMGFSGPFRGEIGEATEGSLRTFCFIRWPGHIQPNATSYAMFSIMDFMPTFASILGVKLPADRPIDGVDQTAVLTGKSKTGPREHLLTFIGPDLVAVRWKQWRFYFKDMAPTGTEFQKVGGTYMNSAEMYFPKVFNIEMDPHEDLNLGGVYLTIAPFAYKYIIEYGQSVAKYPNPPAPNTTNFRGK
ncbi:MAG TPA: arylsulfatase [Anaeromyxobacteraceae bacterium]|nr:arylsulfatase [Anaeromyxobacteraceae bacterium]